MLSQIGTFTVSLSLTDSSIGPILAWWVSLGVREAAVGQPEGAGDDQHDSRDLQSVHSSSPLEILPRAGYAGPGAASVRCRA